MFLPPSQPVVPDEKLPFTTEVVPATAAVAVRLTPPIATVAAAARRNKSLRLPGPCRAVSHSERAGLACDMYLPAADRHDAVRHCDPRRMAQLQGLE